MKPIIEIPAGRGARRKARRLADACVGERVIAVMSRRGRETYQAIWTPDGVVATIIDWSPGWPDMTTCPRSQRRW